MVCIDENLDLQKIVTAVFKILQFKIGYNLPNSEVIRNRLNSCLPCKNRIPLEQCESKYPFLQKLIKPLEKEIGTLGRCKICSCYLLAKISTDGSCPLNKW